MRYQKLAILGLMLLLLGSCKTVQYVPVEHTEYVTVRDTTYLHRVDTLVKVPEYHLSDFVDVEDTLRLHAGIATATAWLDTLTSSLKGTLVTDGKIPVTVVERERVVYRDSVVTKDIPVPVEKPVPYVPWIAKFLSSVGMLAILAVVGYLVFRFWLRR